MISCFQVRTFVGLLIILLQRHICEVLLFTAILRNKQARNTRFIKPISVKLTHAQTFFRGVSWVCLIFIVSENAIFVFEKSVEHT